MKKTWTEKANKKRRKQVQENERNGQAETKQGENETADARQKREERKLDHSAAYHRDQSYGIMHQELKYNKNLLASAGSPTDLVLSSPPFLRHPFCRGK